MYITARVRSELESRNDFVDTRRHVARVYDVTICICITSSTQNSSSQEPSPTSLRLSFSFSLLFYLLLRVDVSRHVSRVCLWEPIQPRFVNERRMNEASRPSGGCARVYRLLNLHFRRNARCTSQQRYSRTNHTLFQINFVIYKTL